MRKLNLDEKWIDIVREYGEVETVLRKISLMCATYEDKQVIRGLKDYLVYRMARVIFTDESVIVPAPEGLREFYSKYPEESKKIQEFVGRLVSYQDQYMKAG